MFYTGVGSRETPIDIYNLMIRFAALQDKVLRSGGADGADSAFQFGCEQGTPGRKLEIPEIYHPWENFNHNKAGSTPGMFDYTLEERQFAEYVLYKVLPNLWVKPSVMSLFRRNVYQVTGLAINVEDTVCSDFLLCYTKDGCTGRSNYDRSTSGGTGVAILIADEFDVPVFNLQRPKTYNKTRLWCMKREDELGVKWDASRTKHVRRK